MPLQKQQVNVNFARGLDTKTDPWQVPIGNFLELENSVFTKQGLLQKRNGFGQIGTPNDSSVSSLANFNDDIIALGNYLYAYNDPTDTFVNKGSFFPSKVNGQVAVSNSTNIDQSDSVKAPNGLILTVTLSNTILLNEPVGPVKYQIQNSETGQVVVNPTAITVSAPAVISGPAKTYLYNNYFIILFTVTSGGVNSIRFLAIDWTNLTVTGPTILTSIYDPPPGGISGTGIRFDAVTANNCLLVGFNTIGGAGIYCSAITSTLGIFAGVQIDPASQCTVIGACGDGTNAYFMYYDDTTGIGRISGATIISGAISPLAAFPKQWILTKFVGDTTGSNLATNIASTANIFPGTKIFNISGGPYTLGGGLYPYVVAKAGPNDLVLGADYVPAAAGVNWTLGSVKNITGSVVNGVINIICEINSNYDWQSVPAADDNSIFLRTCTTAGVMGTTPTNAIRRGVGLWSKAIVINNQTYFVVSYNKGIISTDYSKRTNQPCYFLINLNGKIIARWAYENGVGYATRGLNFISNDTFSGSVILGSNVVSSIADTSLLKVGQRIISSAFPESNTYITSIDSISQITLNNASTLNGGALFQFPDIFVGYLRANDLQTQNAGFGDGGVVQVLTYQNQAAYNSKIELFCSDTNSVQLGNNLNLNGGILWNYDGYQLTENNFLISPDSIGLQNIGAGNLTAQQYWYRVIYQWTDNQGNLNRSAASIPVTITVVGPSSKIRLYIPTLRMTYKNTVSIAVYRLSAGQTTYYRLGTISGYNQNLPGQDYVIYEDNQADSSIIGNEILYSQGDVVDNNAPPSSNCVTGFDNRLWIADSETENQIYYSKTVIPGTPVEMSSLFSLYVSPSQSSQGLSGPVKCLFPMDDKLIIFKENAIYYLNGTGPDNTGANSQYSEPILITATVGCSNPKSIVFMQNGLMFQSNKGIWLLTRDLQTGYIGAPVESLTQNALVNSACLVPGTNQVRMGLSSGVMLMYDYFYQQWGSFTNIPSQAAIVSLGKHTLLDAYGRILQETPNYYLDAGNPVLMKFKTAWFALGGIQGFERAYFAFLLGKYYSPHKLVVGMSYDFDPSETQQTIISPDNYNAPWGNDPVYGSTYLWGGNSQVEKWRLMLQRQKCDSVQLSVEEQYDPSVGPVAGQGLTLSGINFIIGIKRSFQTVPAVNTVG